MCRVAVVTSYFPTREQPYRGHSAYQILRELRRWVDVEVFCPLPQYPSFFQPRNFTYLPPDLTYAPADLTAHYFEYPAVPGFSRPFNPLVCAGRLLPRIRRFQPDVILNYFIYPEGCAAVHVGKHLNIPVVLGALGSDINRIPDPVTRRYTRWALRGASFLIAVSEQLRAAAIRLGASPDRVKALPNSCDPVIFHPQDRVAARRALGLPADRKIVLFVGWLSPTKGLRELLTAMKTIAPRYPDSQLVLVGEGALRPELEQEARTAGLAERVTFAGVRSSTEVASYLAAADVFSLPSYAEGCPNVVIEALGCGRPVVATNVGGIPDLVDSERGILVSPRDPQALAEALTSALDRQWDERFISSKFQDGWHAVAQETLTCLESCLRNRRFTSSTVGAA